jgi:opacity protein-like surface antigen
MSKWIATLALGIATLTGLGAAQSADFTRTAPGIRYGGAAPVPAPAPIPDAPARWYFRADLALGFPDDPTFFTHGLSLANGGLRTTPGMYRENNDVYAGYGLGVGYRFSPWFRMDMTVDTRSQKKYSFENFSYTSGGITGTASDSITLRSVSTLFNAYIDMPGYGRFVPYIGGGLGFAVNELIHGYTITETGGGASSTGREKTHDVSLAAMGTVGFAYNIDEMTALDINYRALYVGSSAVGTPGMNGHARIGDQLDHQLRAGVRFNVN